MRRFLLFLLDPVSGQPLSVSLSLSVEDQADTSSVWREVSPPHKPKIVLHVSSAAPSKLPPTNPLRRRCQRGSNTHTHTHTRRHAREREGSI